MSTAMTPEGPDRRSPGERTTAGVGPGGRQSIASARPVVPGSNRNQLRLVAVAIVLMVIVVVLGLVLNKLHNAPPVTDHPRSTNSTASVLDGVVTVTGGLPLVTIDLYEDGICPVCGDFERQYGQQVMKGVDEGKLTVRYHFLDFLNLNSTSRNYSSRVAAAFDCVAAVPEAQAPKGLFLNFHTTMFSAGVQPAEGSTDLTDAQLADLAVKAGAPQSAAACITSGTDLGIAQSAAKAGQAVLKQVIGPDWSTPTALQNGMPLGINSNDWLTKLIH